jgi:transcriptional regulator of acetoin/glycerol metabolism
MRHARVRIVAATHRDLARRSARGRFRADLWYRLAAVEVTLPPLRTRGDDVFLLAHAFLQKARAGASLDPGARKAIAAYAWPGNVRELAQAMAHAALFAESARIESRHLPSRVVQGAAPVAGHGLKGEIERLERARIDRALAEAGGNCAKAARRLGLSRQGLWLKLRRLPRDNA